MKRKLGVFMVSLIMVVSLSLLAWGFWPPHRETIILPLLPADGTPSLPEKRMIHLTFSPVMRAGETQTVELDLVTEGETASASLYQEYNVVLEARLELPFADVRPANLVSTALVEGGDATFYWEVNPRQVSDLQGTVWLYLRLIRKAGGKETRKPVSAQLIEISSKSLLGWTGSEVRIAGSVGLLLGLALGVLLLGVSRVNS
jgi:hypothetical protein